MPSHVLLIARKTLTIESLVNRLRDLDSCSFGFFSFSFVSSGSFVRESVLARESGKWKQAVSVSRSCEGITARGQPRNRLEDHVEDKTS